MYLYLCGRTRCRNRCLPNDNDCNYDELSKRFDCLYILSCGHCLCEKCIYILVQEGEKSIKCDQCGAKTNCPAKLFTSIKSSSLSNAKRIGRLNEDCPDALPIDAYSFGVAFNRGQIMALPVETITLDEGPINIEQDTMITSSDDVDAENVYLRQFMPSTKRPKHIPLIHTMHNALTVHSKCGESLKTIVSLQKDLNKELYQAKMRMREKFHHLHCLLQLEEWKAVALLEERSKVRKDQFAALENELISLKNKFKEIFTQRTHETMDALSKKRDELKEAILKPSGISVHSYDPKDDFVFEFEESLSSLVKNCLTLEDLPANPVELHYVDPQLKSPYKKYANELSPSSLPNADDSPSQLYPSCSSPMSASPPLLTNIPQVSSSRATPTPTTSSSILNVTPVPLLTSGFREEIVKLSKFHTPELFFVTIHNNPERVKHLQRLIDDWCCTSFTHTPPLGSIKVGGHCFAFSPLLKKWCRASLLSIYDNFEPPLFSRKRPHPEKARPNIVTQAMASFNSHSGDVELYDYGGTERVAYSNLRPPFEELFDQEIYPHLALKCSLHSVKPRGDEWSERAINSFHSYCSDRRLKLLIKETIGDLHMVDIMQYDLDDVPLRNASVRELLVFTNEARLQLNDVDETRFTTNPLITFRSPNQLSLTGCKMVLVTQLVSPDLFHVTLYSEQEKFHAFHERLQVYFDLPEEAYTVYCPKKNLPCVALGDGSYYRALIKQVLSPDQVEVEFVDFGNVKVIPASNLRLIRNEFLGLPIQAIPCKLAGVAPARGFTWSKAAIDKFKELVLSDPYENNQILNLNVVSYQDSRRHVVTLRRYTGSEYLSINAALVNLKLAISTDPTSQSSSEVVVMSEYQDPNSRFDTRVLNQLKDFDVCGFNILAELVRRNIDARSTKIDSLIKVHLSHWVSPSEFYVQIMTPEVKSYFICYENKLSDNNKHLLNEPMPASQDPLNIGEACLYIIQEDYSSTLKRAIIRDREPDDDDPLFDSPKTLYTVFARDYGFTVQVERRFIRKLPSDSEYLKDGDFCIRCHLSDVAPAGGGDWTKTAIEEFAIIVNKYRSKLLIFNSNKYLPTYRPESVAVDLFAKEITIADALAPKKTKFHSFKNLLVNRGIAIPIKGSSLSDDEEEPDPSCSSQSPRANMPYSLKSRSSIISYLKGGHHRVNEQEAAMVQFYKEPERPKCEQFIAISSEVDLKMKIWFRIWEIEGGQPIDMVNRRITQALREKDELTPFIGDALFTRACSAYFKHDKTWNRAEILTQDREGFIVRYIDYGNMDRVSTENISSDVFNLEIPKLALHGYLSGCRPLIDEEKEETLRDTIHQLIVDKKCVISWENFKSPDDMKISVVLPDGRSLKDVLIEKNLVVEDFSLDQHLPMEMRTYLDLIEASEYTASTTAFEQDVYYPVAVTGSFTNNYVFIQHLSLDSPRLNNIERAINEKNDQYLLALETMRSEIRQFVFRDSYKPGDCCCAQFSDGEWYRGLIVEVIPENKYKILYIDYGNTDVVGVEKLRQLPYIYMHDLQIHAIPVRVCNIRPARGGPWNKRLLKRMDKTALAHSEDTLALFKNTQSPWDVELYIADPENPRSPHQSFFQSFIGLGELVPITAQDAEEEII